jgi:hypothetical protein
MSAYLFRFFLPRLTAAACLFALPACSGDGIMVPGDGSIARLVAVAGDGQRAVVGRPVAEPLVVRAVDQGNRPVTGAAITFRFINTDGRIAPGTMTTGADGQATAEVTLGGSVGAQVVEARVVDPDGLAVEFQLTALQRETPDPPAPPAPGGNGGNGGNNGDDGNGNGGNGGGGNAGDNGNDGHGNGGNGNGSSGNGGSGHGGGGGSAGGGGGGGGGDLNGGSGGGDEGDGGNGGSGGNGGNGNGKGHHDHGDRHGHGHGHHGGGEN